MEPVDPLGRVQGKLSSAAGSWLFSRVKVSDAQGLSSLAELCVSNINNVSDAADVSSIKFQDTSQHIRFLRLLAELRGITHSSVHAKASFSLNFFSSNSLDSKMKQRESQKMYFL